MVKAEYIDKREYARVADAVCFARLKPSQIVVPGGWKGSYIGEIVLHTFEKNEVAALEALLEILATTGVPIEEDPRPVMLDLAGAIAAKRPWELCPMGLRGGKRRDPRTKWRDANGKRINIIIKTGKPHADPNCPCDLCFNIAPPPEDDEDDDE